MTVREHPFDLYINGEFVDVSLHTKKLLSQLSAETDTPIETLVNFILLKFYAEKKGFG